MEQGPTEQKIIEMALRQGHPLPQRIANAPDLFLGLQLYYTGFMDLNDERQIGLAEGPIPWRAISEYCGAHGIAGEQRDDFFYLVKRMDQAYLSWSAKRNKAAKEAMGKGVKKGGKGK